MYCISNTAQKIFFSGYADNKSIYSNHKNILSNNDLYKIINQFPQELIDKFEKLYGYQLNEFYKNFLNPFFMDLSLEDKLYYIDFVFSNPKYVLGKYMDDTFIPYLFYSIHHPSKPLDFLKDEPNDESDNDSERENDSDQYVSSDSYESFRRRQRTEYSDQESDNDNDD